jgi:hypothetical protein
MVDRNLRLVKLSDELVNNFQIRFQIGFVSIYKKNFRVRDSSSANKTPFLSLQKNLYLARIKIDLLRVLSEQILFTQRNFLHMFFVFHQKAVKFPKINSRFYFK